MGSAAISIGEAVWDCSNCTDEIGWFAVICDNCFADEEYKSKHNPLHKPRRLIAQKESWAIERCPSYQPGIMLCAEPGCGKCIIFLHDMVISSPLCDLHLQEDRDVIRTVDWPPSQFLMLFCIGRKVGNEEAFPAKLVSY
jgi:hypothetical protein